MLLHRWLRLVVSAPPGVDGGPGGKALGSPSSMARRRSPVHPPAKVPLSPDEAVQARLLARVAVRLQVRQDAAALLQDGADPDHLHDLRVSTTTSLCGAPVAMQRWGASSPEACRLAQRRVRQAGLVDSALYLSVLYDVARDAPPPIFLGGGSGLGGAGEGLAWAPSSGVDPSIRVRRYPPPEQLEIWDSDGVSWMYWAEMRASED